MRKIFSQSRFFFHPIKNSAKKGIKRKNNSTFCFFVCFQDFNEEINKDGKTLPFFCSISQQFNKERKIIPILQELKREINMEMHLKDSNSNYRIEVKNSSKNGKIVINLFYCILQRFGKEIKKKMIPPYSFLHCISVKILTKK